VPSVNVSVRKPGRGASTGARVFALFVAILAGAALVEVGARIWLVHLAPEDVARRYATISQIRQRAATEGFSYSLFEEHPYLGFVPSANYVRNENRHNALGFRGSDIALPKPAGEFRVVCLGGSTTYNPFIEDPAKAFPAQLEAALHARGFTQVRVINGGVPGYRSYESLLNLQFRVLDLEPDLVFVYHAPNDVMARLVWPPDAYRGDNTGAIRRGASAARDLEWYQHSSALRMLSIRFGDGKSPAILGTTFVEYAPSARGPVFTMQVLNGRYPAGDFAKHPAERMLEANPPRYFRRNLEHLVLIAQHAGAVPVLSSFTACDCVQDASSRPEILAAIREMNDVARGVADELGAPFLDLDLVFPRERRLFEDSIHVNAAGAARRGELVAELMLEAHLIPAP
jgi:lysophospholipase L1-like esterase